MFKHSMMFAIENHIELQSVIVPKSKEASIFGLNRTRNCMTVLAFPLLARVFRQKLQIARRLRSPSLFHVSHVRIYLSILLYTTVYIMRKKKATTTVLAEKKENFCKLLCK